MDTGDLDLYTDFMRKHGSEASDLIQKLVYTTLKLILLKNGYIKHIQNYNHTSYVFCQISLKKIQC
jgi:hypothetical protein